MSSHEAFFLYRNSLSILKWLHLLRSSPCWETPILANVDCSQRMTISELLNVSLSDSSWSQSVDLVPSAFMASAHLVKPLVYVLLQPIAMSSFDYRPTRAPVRWCLMSEAASQNQSLSPLQCEWDDAVCSTRMHDLMGLATSANRAHLLASG